eukprot:CAMPEP_0204069572 /NCGR_PEP_ID=MMETSP0360-20130528/157091_1 /ASSEMBLY_ACC=CAM_ASM_000342 /TAXON_ID=268821 /ORGANISM="Scrippsiella Hangoei, Strain SHTV-5" /LENGTH=84 /DNA_ID=CAMNT_0051017745 /DNA_START=186 /DNA_END=440 /DNA_ORIENTATION=+
MSLRPAAIRCDERHFVPQLGNACENNRRPSGAELCFCMEADRPKTSLWLNMNESKIEKYCCATGATSTPWTSDRGDPDLLEGVS